MGLAIWTVPLTAVPFLGCLAAPIAWPVMLLLAVCPVMLFDPDLPMSRMLAGAALLLIAGVANVALVVRTLTVAQAALLGRDSGPGLVPTIGWALVVWGLLLVGASVGRASSLPAAAGFATSFVAVGPLACAVLALYEAAGLSLGT